MPWGILSQSFIHQVRILSILWACQRALPRAGRRNPLFIKSEFSHWKEDAVRHPEHVVAILYSSSQNSLNLPSFGWKAVLRSQSFIHQVRILSSYLRWDICLWLPQLVAILYSSSQNSLLSKLEEALHIVNDGRNPLFIKSEFSLYERYCYWKRDAQEVAILYSSSQNSLFLGSSFCCFLASTVAILYSSSQNSLRISRWKMD